VTARALLFVASLAAVLAAGAEELPLRVPGKPVAALPKARPAQEGFRDPAYPQAWMRTIRLPQLDRPLVMDLPGGDTKRTRIGVRRDMPQEAISEGGAVRLQWAAAPAGGRTARMQLASPDAQSMRLGLRIVGLPQDAELRFAGSAGERRGTPIAATRIMEAMRVQGLFWTPATEGDSQTVELWLPPTADEAALRVEVESISHLASAASGRFKSAGIGAAQSCHEDVACLARDDPALGQAARAVARLLYTENGTTYLCTGTLINDGDSASQTPYLYTAAHCIGSQAAAASLETYWFFEAANCASGTPADYTQLSGGATLLHASDATDAAILRLHDAAPEGAWFAGWDATPVATGIALLGLHHPAGDLKKAALGRSLDLSSNIVASWSRGSTEGGSSGSGVFTAWNGEYLLRGGLRGGTASCPSSGRLGDPANRDYYSRLDLELEALRKTLALPNAPPRSYEGLWWNPAEPGWGLSIVRGAPGRSFVTWYTYDAEGRPTWLAMPDASWRGTDTLEGTLYRATGNEAGRTYDARRFTMTPVGSGRIDFTPEGATLDAVIDGRAVALSMRRLEP